MFYVNCRYPDQAEPETLDEFETRREADLMAVEYRIAFNPGDKIYVSRRACGNWSE